MLGMMSDDIKQQEDLKRVAGEPILPLWLKQRLTEIHDYLQDMPLPECVLRVEARELLKDADPDEAEEKLMRLDDCMTCIQCQRATALTWAIAYIGNGCQALVMPEKIQHVREFARCWADVKEIYGDES